MTSDERPNGILHDDACAHDSAARVAIIDFDHLKRYTLADRELERELLALFAGQAWVYLDALRGAGNINAWREAAHGLKGSAKGIGAWQVAEAATCAEQLRRGPRDAEAGGVLRRLEDAVAAAQRFIDKYGAHL